MAVRDGVDGHPTFNSVGRPTPIVSNGTPFFVRLVNTAGPERPDSMALAILLDIYIF